MHKQKGFTLIELVVVMVVIGILAAFAIPRFYDFRAQSRIAVLNGVGGAMMSAAYVAHGAQLAQGLGPDGTVTMEGQAVTMAFAYPTAAGINLALNTDVPSTADGVYGYNATCIVTYTPPAALNSVPAISYTTTGCSD